MPKKDFYQISLKALIKNDKNEILILKGLLSGSYAKFYDLPGGRIDDNEFNMPFDKILIREIGEEIGKVKIKLNMKPVALSRHMIPARLTASKKALRILHVFFEAKLLAGKIKISDEHLGYRWQKITKRNIKQYFCTGILEGVREYLKKK
ncbi:MAG: NUDIX domain-containing protein [Parcubacteria group bacterium]